MNATTPQADPVPAGDPVPDSRTLTFDLAAGALPLFFRWLGTSLAMIVVLPAPWVTCWLARWLATQLRVSDGTSVTFRGTPASVALVALGYAILSLVSGAPTSEDEAAWIWIQTLASLGTLALWWAFLRWFIGNLALEDSTLRFDGSFRGYLGWSLLTMVLVVTIVGWAWAAAAFLRWVTRHVGPPTGHMQFVGRGHQILWRTLVAMLWCLPLVTIPWAIRWLYRWHVQQVHWIRPAAATVTAA